MPGKYSVDEMSKAIRGAHGLVATGEKAAQLIKEKPISWRLQLLGLLLPAIESASPLFSLDVAKMKAEALELDQEDKAKLDAVFKELDLKNDSLEKNIEDAFSMILAGSNLVGQLWEMVQKFVAMFKPQPA